MSAEVIEDETELVQLKADLMELKEQVKRLNIAESSHSEELQGFRSKFGRLKKYFSSLSTDCKEKTEFGRECSRVLKGLSRTRPIRPHWLLRFVLGNHLTYKLLTTKDQVAYKKEYEQFKITLTIGHLILSALGLILFKKPSPFFDGLVPLYSTIGYWSMIGREAVLKMNGSNIRGWWLAHHLISMILSGIMIIWDKKHSGYPQLRSALFLFYLYIGSVQVLQYRYQMNRLYALRSLSRVNPMETTNELSQNLINHDLLFLLPFLLVAYLAEFYLAHLIWSLRSGPVCLTISALYFTLATGNTLTTCYTYHKKLCKQTTTNHCDGNKDDDDEDDNRNGLKKVLLMRQFTKSSEDLSLDRKDE